MDEEQYKKVYEKFCTLSDEERDELRQKLDYLFKRMKKILENSDLQTYDNIIQLNRELKENQLMHPKYRLYNDAIYKQYSELAREVAINALKDKYQSFIKDKTNT